METEGIPTISITHLVDLTKKVRVPRALQLRFPLGRSFGKANDIEMQRNILLDALRYIKEIHEPETIVKLPYRWGGRNK